MIPPLDSFLFPSFLFSKRKSLLKSIYILPGNGTTLLLHMCISVSFTYIIHVEIIEFFICYLHILNINPLSSSCLGNIVSICPFMMSFVIHIWFILTQFNLSFPLWIVPFNVLRNPSLHQGHKDILLYFLPIFLKFCFSYLGFWSIWNLICV